MYADMSNLTFDESSYVAFHSNHADGGMHSIKSNVTFNGDSVIAFYNTARRKGGAGNFIRSIVTFNDDSVISFSRNHVKRFGRALCLFNYGMIFKGNITVLFSNNHAVKSYPWPRYVEEQCILMDLVL